MRQYESAMNDRLQALNAYVEKLKSTIWSRCDMLEKKDRENVAKRCENHHVDIKEVCVVLIGFRMT